MVTGGIKNWDNYLAEIYRLMKSSGSAWVQLSEFSPRLRCDDESIPEDAACRVVPQQIFLSENQSGIDYDIATTLKARVQKAGFVDVRQFIDRIPVGRSGINLCRPAKQLDETEVAFNLGNGLCGLFDAVLKSPLAERFDPRDIGYETVDNLTDAVLEDYQNPDFHGYMKLY